MKTAKNMKTAKFATIAILVLNLTCSASDRETIILSDDFMATANPDVSDINYNLKNRQSGSEAIQSWTGDDLGWAPEAKAELGTADINVGQPESTDGQVLIFRKGAQVSLAGLNLSSNNVHGPLIIKFDMYKGVGNGAEWTSFTLTETINPGYGGEVGHSGFPVQTGPSAFGFLRRGNNEVQVWCGTTSGSSTAISDQFSLLVTDSAGTGSPFAGKGTKIKLTNGDTVIGTYDVAGGMSNAFIAFGTDNLQIGGIGNLIIKTVGK